MSDNQTQSFEEQVLEFTKESISTVESLQKKAADLQKERDTLVSDLEAERTRNKELSLKKEASAKPALDQSKVAEISQLLATAGIVKMSAEKLESSLLDNPNELVDIFQSFLNADDGDGSETTTMKFASETKKDLWRQAAAN